MRSKLLLLWLSLLQPASGLELPKAPESFDWLQLVEIKSAVLVPQGWFTKHQNAGDVNLWAISKENVDEDGFFETGLTFISRENVQTRPQGKALPSRFARALVDGLKSKYGSEKSHEG